MERAPQAMYLTHYSRVGGVPALAQNLLSLLDRTVSLALDGAVPTAYPPMIAEAVMIVALLLARRSFAR
jgi:hypothetical protein